MAGRTHLFFAMSSLAFGEVALAIRLCWQLHAIGDRIVFLTPSGLAMLFAGTPFRHGTLDAAWRTVDHLIPTVVAEQRVDTVVIVDAASLYLAFAALAIDDAFLRRLPVPVLAFDVWNLPETTLQWDTGTEIWRLPPAAAQFARRLVPVPFVRPDPAPGHYNALPALPVGGPPGAREATRRELGLGDGQRLLVTATALWQTARAAVSPYQHHLVRAVPPLVVSHFAAMPAAVRVLHVGPEPLAGAEVLGDRYRWIARVGAERMAALLAAADVFFTLNAPATTITTAIAIGLPVVLATNAVRGATPADLEARAPAPLTAAVRALLPALAPLAPFAAWPLGIHAFLAPLWRDNPYTDAIRRVELLDQVAVARACGDVAAPGPARDALQATMDTYRAQIATLPSALDELERGLRQ